MRKKDTAAVFISNKIGFKNEDYKNSKRRKKWRGNWFDQLSRHYKIM